MWVGTVLASEMRSQARWKVELFCRETPTASHAAFSLVTLRQIVNERKETIDPQAHPNQLFNYLGLEHVQPATGDLVDFAPRKGKEVKSRSKIFRRGDVLYGRLRPYLNKVYVADRHVSSGICSGEFYVLTPKQNRVLPNFLRAVLASDYVQQYVAGLQTGSALPRLHLEDLLKIEIPLPSISKQQSFETFLLRQNAHRRQLAAELVALPRATIQAVVQALETGREPIMPALSDSAIETEEENPILLPGQVSFVTGALSWEG